MPLDASLVPVARTRRRKLAREYGLVLAAAGIDCELVDESSEVIVGVAPLEAARAADELTLYDQENRGWRRAEELPLALGESWLAVTAWILVLLATHLLSLSRALGADWWTRGRLQAQAVRDGEAWRAVTALGLHIDPLHLAGNVLFGALFVALVAEMLGTGVGLFAVLVTGALANLANAWLHEPSFSAVGASTAVFAALGLLGGHRWQQRKLVRSFRRTSWIPLLAAAFLLAMLGSGGGHDAEPAHKVDVAGHALGFLAGGIAGAVQGRWMSRWRPAEKVQLAFGLAALGLFCGAWALALR